MFQLNTKPPHRRFPPLPRIEFQSNETHETDEALSPQIPIRLAQDDCFELAALEKAPPEKEGSEISTPQVVKPDEKKAVLQMPHPSEKQALRIVSPNPETQQQSVSGNHTQTTSTALETVPFSNLVNTTTRNLSFRQRDVGDCYFLAGLDALLNHPDGEALLQQIKIEARRNSENQITSYKVTFPTGKTAHIRLTEIGVPKQGKKLADAPFYIQLLELAYGKATRDKRAGQPQLDADQLNTVNLMEGGMFGEALRDMLGGELVQDELSTITQNYPSCDPLGANPNAVNALENFLSNLANETTHTVILGANTPAFASAFQPGFYEISIRRADGSQITIPRGHSCSIRNFDLANRTITVADPYDTSDKVYTLSFEEFCQLFRAIPGMKLKKT
jgi:hypothetical protein